MSVFRLPSLSEISVLFILLKCIMHYGTQGHKSVRGIWLYKKRGAAREHRARNVTSTSASHPPTTAVLSLIQTPTRTNKRKHTKSIWLHQAKLALWYATSMWFHVPLWVWKLYPLRSSPFYVNKYNPLYIFLCVCYALWFFFFPLFLLSCLFKQAPGRFSRLLDKILVKK